MDFGNRIRELMKIKNISITELSKIIGINRVFLSRIINNHQTPSFETLQKICDALGITLAEFFSDEDSAMPPEITRLLQEVKDLTPEQIDKLTEFIKVMK